VLSTIFLAGCSVVGIRSVDEPPFTTVEELEAGIEIRRYPARLAAETRLAVDSDDPEGRAFRRLFAYISGANDGGQEIAMTAPVEQRSGSEIAMTAPVEQITDAAGYVMRFFLPEGMTAATAPRPTDPAVHLATLPPATWAVQRFTGSRSRETIAQRQTALVTSLAATPWRPTAEPTAWLYDPPWTLPFLRRNEVAVPVTREASGG